MLIHHTADDALGVGAAIPACVVGRCPGKPHKKNATQDTFRLGQETLYPE